MLTIVRYYIFSCEAILYSKSIGNNGIICIFWWPKQCWNSINYQAENRKQLYKLEISRVIFLLLLLTWHTLQNVIKTQKCVPNQKNQLWTGVFSSVQQKSQDQPTNLPSSTSNLFQHFRPDTAKDICLSADIQSLCITFVDWHSRTLN